MCVDEIKSVGSREEKYRRINLRNESGRNLSRRMYEEGSLIG